MKDFLRNRCRICPKVFCCQNCCCKHEEKFHNIMVDCEFCVFKTGIVKQEYPAVLLKHIAACHFPLRCNYCRKLFISITDLLTHIKCKSTTMLKFKENKDETPMKHSISDSMKSPFTPHSVNIGYVKTNLGHKDIVTSTPLQRNEDFNTKMLEKLSQTLTPVEFLDTKEGKSAGQIVADESVETRYGQTQKVKHVTFSNTPIVEPCKKPKQNIISNDKIGKLESMEETNEQQCEEEEIQTSTHNSEPLEAMEQVQQQSETSNITQSPGSSNGEYHSMNKIENDVSYGQEDEHETLWHSAMASCLAQLNEESNGTESSSSNESTGSSEKVDDNSDDERNQNELKFFQDSTESNSSVADSVDDTSQVKTMLISSSKVVSMNDASKADSVNESSDVVVDKYEDLSVSITIENHDSRTSDSIEQCHLNETEHSSSTTKDIDQIDVTYNTQNDSFETSSKIELKSKGILSSLTSLMKSMVGLSNNDDSTSSSKRALEENDTSIFEPDLKRLKYCEIKCRPPIRDIGTIIYLRASKPMLVDKWTQTDF